MNTTLVIGIAGGTGAGKTTIAREISQHFGPENVTVIEHDDYYNDVTHLTYEEREEINFDHPAALDNVLLIEHLRALRAGHAIDKPVHDFLSHNRAPHTLRVEPRPILVVEGILLFENPMVRSLLDIAVYVDTEPDIRMGRRILRDLQERGRTVEQVLQQYMTVVRPMHLKFVEPCKAHADLILDESSDAESGLQQLIAKIQEARSAQFAQ